LMRRESTGAHFTLKLANSGMTSVGRARFKSPLAHSLQAAPHLVKCKVHLTPPQLLGLCIISR
jgi:hypothetical protein